MAFNGKGIIMLKQFMGAVLVLASLVTGGTAWAEGKQNFTLKNRTGYTVAEVYVSPAKSDDWEEDVMGGDVLDNGQDVHIQFSRAAKSCMWDLKVVYDDEVEAEWAGFDLCKVSTISIFYDRKKDETWAEYE